MHDETGGVPPDRQAGEEEDRQRDDGVDPQLSQRPTVYGLLEDLQTTARIVLRCVDEFGERRVTGHRLVVEDTRHVLVDGADGEGGDAEQQDRVEHCKAKADARCGESDVPQARRSNPGRSGAHPAPPLAPSR